MNIFPISASRSCHRLLSSTSMKGGSALFLGRTLHQSTAPSTSSYWRVGLIGTVALLCLGIYTASKPSYRTFLGSINIPLDIDHEGLNQLTWELVERKDYDAIRKFLSMLRNNRHEKIFKSIDAEGDTSWQIVLCSAMIKKGDIDLLSEFFHQMNKGAQYLMRTVVARNTFMDKDDMKLGIIQIIYGEEWLDMLKDRRLVFKQ